jgi:hypothetical protein
MNTPLGYRIVNTLIWCAALAYVVHRTPADLGWDFAGDVGLVALICLMICEQCAGAWRDGREGKS